MNERVRPTGVQGGQQLEGWTVVASRGGFRLMQPYPSLLLAEATTSAIIVHQPGESMGLLLALTYATSGS